MIQIKNKNILVLGLGVSGYESAKFLAQKGANVYVSEKNSSPNIDKFASELKEKFNCRVETGSHSRDFCHNCHSAVISPGIDPASSEIKTILPDKINLISEIELASLFSPAYTVAVTGTNGKSTTVELINNVVSLSGRKSVLCGNIGTPYIGKINDMDPGTVAVVEISSFQLEKIKTFKPDIAVILNITDDHYERHKDYKTYKTEKYKIFKNHDKNSWLIINESLRDDEEFKDYKGNLVTFGFGGDSVVTIKDNWIISSIGKRKKNIFDTRGIFLKGRHNIENIMAAAAACHIMGITKKYINDGIKSFKGLSHRFETIAEFNGISYIDDSKGTNVDGTLMALRSLDKNIILIAGGIDKGGDYTPLIDMVRDKVKTLILIGEAKDKLFSIFGDLVKTVREKSMDTAVQTAFKNAVKGDTVLLSPMCSSFDMFRDYKDRGDKFKKAVFRVNDK